MATVTPDPKPEARHVASRDEWDRIVLAKAGPCRGCGQPGESFHHLVPKGAGHGGGDDVAANVIPMCGSGTTGCHGTLQYKTPGWEEIAHAVRASLTPVERQYVVAKKGHWWLDKHLPSGDEVLCPSCRRRKTVRLETEAPRPRKSWTVSVPVDHRENGYVILTELVEQARVKIGRPEGTPPYFTLVEVLAVFCRDAVRELA